MKVTAIPMWHYIQVWLNVCMCVCAFGCMRTCICGPWVCIWIYVCVSGNRNVCLFIYIEGQLRDSRKNRISWSLEERTQRQPVDSAKRESASGSERRGRSTLRRESERRISNSPEWKEAHQLEKTHERVWKTWVGHKTDELRQERWWDQRERQTYR